MSESDFLCQREREKKKKKREKKKKKEKKKKNSTISYPDRSGGKRRRLPPHPGRLPQHLHVGPERRLAHAVGVEVKGVLVEVREMVSVAR